MATLDSLINSSLERLTTVPDAFVNSADAIQKAMLNDVVDIMTSLQTENGVFIYNEFNLNQLNTISKKLTDSIFNDEYTSSLTSYLQEFNAQADINNKIFAQTVEGFSTKDIYATTVKNTQKTTLELFGQDAFGKDIIAPITNQLTQSVVNGGNFAETVKAVESFILGNGEVNGVIKGYIKTNAYDAFAISNATYSQAVYSDLNIEWYVYRGGLRDTSRCFCIERNGKYFHKKEIEAWGRGDDLGICNVGGGRWAGERKGTDQTTIFALRGGYNCDHVFMGQSKINVPKAVVERAKSKGYV